MFAFDKKRWCSDWNQVQSIATRSPHFSILEALAIGNERMIPQQALSSFTNVDDIEAYIGMKDEGREPYLQVIDLPASAAQRGDAGTQPDGYHSRVALSRY